MLASHSLSPSFRGLAALETGIFIYFFFLEVIAISFVIGVPFAHHGLHLVLLVWKELFRVRKDGSSGINPLEEGKGGIRV